MTTEKKGCLAFAVCGSFCTLEDALGAAQALTAQGWTLLPIMSFAAQQDTRFGTGESWRQRLQAVAGQPPPGTRYWTRCRRWSRWDPGGWHRHWWSRPAPAQRWRGWRRGFRIRR